MESVNDLAQIMKDLSVLVIDQVCHSFGCFLINLLETASCLWVSSLSYSRFVKKVRLLFNAALMD